MAGQAEANKEGQKRNPKARDVGDPPHPKRREWANCNLTTKGQGAQARGGLGWGGRVRVRGRDLTSGERFFVLKVDLPKRVSVCST